MNSHPDKDYELFIVCYSVNVSFPFKHISETLPAYDVGGIGTNFLPKTGDMHVDGAFGNYDASPDCIHELLAGEDMASVL